MAIERKASFKPQGVAGAKPDRLHFFMREQRLGQGFSMFGQHRNLIAILTGVTRSGDAQLDPVPQPARAGHELEIGKGGLIGGLRSEVESAHHRHRLRTLQRQQRVIFHVVQRDARRQPCSHVGDVAILGCAVDDEIEIAARAGDHQVVQNAAIVRQQQRITHAVGLQRLEVTGRQAFQPFGGAFPFHQQLAHVRHVEQPCMFTRPQMLGDDAVKLDRHGIAGKAHHARAQTAMQRIQRQCLQINVIRHAVPRQQSRFSLVPNLVPPLSPDLRALTGQCPAYPFGGVKA